MEFSTKTANYAMTILPQTNFSKWPVLIYEKLFVAVVFYVSLLVVKIFFCSITNSQSKTLFPYFNGFNVVNNEGLHA